MRARRPSKKANPNDIGQLETASLFLAVILGALGFRARLESAVELKKGEETGKKKHRFIIPSIAEVPMFDGTKRVYKSNAIRLALKEQSKKGRLCHLDDNMPEHPALYCAQGLLNYGAIMRHIHQGMPLYRYTWAHTTRAALINGRNDDPHDYLLDELSLSANGAAKFHDELSSVASAQGSSLDGVSDKVVTDNAPIGVALATAGFPLSAHRTADKTLFILPKKAEVTETSVEPIQQIRGIWEAEKIQTLATTPSDNRRWNRLEDSCPESPILYVAATILSYYQVLGAVRRAKNPRFELTADGTLQSAFIREGHTGSFDKLVKLFKRSGKYHGNIKLL